MSQSFSQESPTQGGRVCRSCNHYNPPGNKWCGNCGAPFKIVRSRKTGSSFATSEFTFMKGLGIVAAILGGIGLLILFFIAYVQVAWLGSLILTSLILWILRPWRAHQQHHGGGAVLLAFVFIGLMGMSLDMGGNALYNQPVRMLCCHGDEQLTQELVSGSYKPGETHWSRFFYCVNARGEARPVSLWALLGIRFSLYFLLCYVLFGIKFIWRRQMPEATN